MNEKSISTLVFASFGFIVFPLAVFTHFHLFADGAFFFARLAETSRVAAAGYSGSRIIGHIITQFPSIFAIQTGTVDITFLSRIYGASLYYIPFACYATAAYFLFRKGMNIQATLLVLMYTILVYFTSYFIISESHFSTGLFIPNISILATCNLGKITALLAIGCIGLIALSCYEFWAIFFPICLMFFFCKIRGHETSVRIKLIYLIIIILYSYGSVANTAGIIFFRDPTNRDAMFSMHMYNVWPYILSACLFFGSMIFYVCFGSLVIRYFNLDRRFNGCSSALGLQRSEMIFPLSLWVIFVVFMFLYSGGIQSPGTAYELRSLNLFLPLLFTLSFLPLHKNAPYSTSVRAIALYCLFPMLVLTIHANLYHTSRWLDFKRSLYKQTQQQSGFVSVNDVEIQNRQFLWEWTSPTLSILLQSMQGKNVKSILFNPNASWQPYGPSEREKAASLAKSMGSEFMLPEPENFNNRIKSDR